MTYIQQHAPSGDVSREISPDDFQTDINSCHSELEFLLRTASTATAAALIINQYFNAFPGFRPIVTIDPSFVKSSWLEPRYATAFVTKKFSELKESIQATSGNQQPVLVQISEGNFELIYGHRRHQACLDLGLPLLVLVSDKRLSAMDVLIAMERENGFSVDLSAFERGRIYKKIIEIDAISAHELARQVGLSHTAINNALGVANLDEVILLAFNDPCFITIKHAKDIKGGLSVDRQSVLLRASQLVHERQRTSKGLAAKKVVEYLLQDLAEEPDLIPLVDARPEFGVWEKVSDGEVLVHLPSGTTLDLMHGIGQLVQNRFEVLRESPSTGV
jgi:ParB family chromosome partitioning protein